LAVLTDRAPVISQPRMAMTEIFRGRVAADDVVGIQHVTGNLDVEIVLVSPEPWRSTYSFGSPIMCRLPQWPGFGR